MTQPSAQARLTLQDAFERFAATVTPDDKRVFNDTKLNDVRDEAIKIERKLRARRTQRNMARLEPFLRGMEHYSKVVEVLCNGTPYLSWIWAPVKLMLMITVDFLSAFEKLIEAYSRIADMMPRMDRLAKALAGDYNVQNVLALVYSDILEFHRRAYKFVRRRSWAIFFSSMWAGFESRFGTILSRLAYHTELLDKEAVAADILDAVNHNKEEAENWEQQEREWRAVKVRTVLSWFGTSGPLLEDTLERHNRDCLPGSCDWFIQHSITQSWLKDSADNALFWLRGKPGAGKSVICSSLVQRAEASNDNVFYYFCSYLGDSTQDCSHLLRCIGSQIIQKHQDLAIHVHDVYFQSHPVPSRKALISLLLELFQGLGSVRIVIDGIDEWNIREQKELLKELKQMISTDPTVFICKILIASRDTLEISRNLRKKDKTAVSMSLSDRDENLAVTRSILRFVDDRLSDLPNHLDDLDPDASILAQVKQTLLDKSNGMFLWVRLVLDALDAVYSPEALRAIVNELPSDLETLYERLFNRLCSTIDPDNYGGVPRMISWICSAQRPFLKYELLNGLAISSADPDSSVQSIPLAQILDHCKPFIEERFDSSVVLIHFSVKEYFLKCKAPQIIPPLQGQQDIAFACATTVLRGLQLLNPGATPSDNLIRIAGGSYRLLSYALEFWIEHCLMYASTGGLLDSNGSLLRLLALLHDTHDQVSKFSNTGGAISNTPVEVFNTLLNDQLKLFAHIPIYTLMKGVLYARHLADRSDRETGEDVEAFVIENDPTLFTKLRATYDRDILYLLSQDEVTGIPRAVLESFQRSYASTAFRCRYSGCPKSSTGFPSQQLRTQHEATHFQRVYCAVSSCQYHRIGFTKRRALNSHMRKYHTENPSLKIPPKVRCSTNIGNSDNANIEEGLVKTAATDLPTIQISEQEIRMFRQSLEGSQPNTTDAQLRQYLFVQKQMQQQQQQQQQPPQAHVSIMTPQPEQSDPDMSALMREAQQRAVAVSGLPHQLTDQVRMNLIPADLDPTIKVTLLKLPDREFRVIIQNYRMNAQRNSQSGSFPIGQATPNQADMIFNSQPPMQGIPSQVVNGANTATINRLGIGFGQPSARQ